MSPKPTLTIFILYSFLAFIKIQKPLVALRAKAFLPCFFWFFIKKCRKIKKPAYWTNSSLGGPLLSSHPVIIDKSAYSGFKHHAHWIIKEDWKHCLTLLRATSERPCQGRGGPWGPPPFFLALEPQIGQKSCFHINLDHFQLIWAFFRIFFPQITKKMQKWKIY